MTEDDVRQAVAAHDAAVAAAIELFRAYGAEISRYGVNDFDPKDEGAVRLTISGDRAELHFTADGYDGDYASSVDFPAAMLWDRNAVAAAIRKARAARAAWSAASASEDAARERREYERLKAKLG